MTHDAVVEIGHEIAQAQKGLTRAQQRIARITAAYEAAERARRHA